MEQLISAETDYSSLTDVPHMSTFQLDSNKIGNIPNSVNLFRGDVTFPLTMASLPGRNGLDVTVTALYNSHVQDTVHTRNMEAPTGILGMGWSLSYDMIVVNTHQSAALDGNEYYLLSKGSANRLVQIGSRMHDGHVILEFAAQNYVFWHISYSTEDERWEIIKEDGVKYIYGGRDSTQQAVQWGIKRGNWIGSSMVDAGQPYARAWNLAQIQHYWGDTITFTYQNDQYSAGSSGHLYTRASYLSRITDVYGRTLVFHYGQKDANEFQAPHVNTGGTNTSAYQDQYETQFLDSLQVNNPNGDLLFSLYCGYELINVHDPSNSSFIKRFLTSVTQINGGTKSQPGFSFEYYTDANDIHPGALKTLTYPEGGIAAYLYQRQAIVSSDTLVSTRIPIANPGGTPRVWFGSDYVVITWYDASASQLYITPYSWGGSWFSASNDMSISHAPISGNSLQVATADDFFAVHFTDSAGHLQVHLYHKNSYQLGEWYSYHPSIDEPPSSPDTSSALAIGDNFVVFAPHNSSTLYRLTWDATGKSWSSDTSGWDTATFIALSAQNNYYVVFGYSATNNQGHITLSYHDGQGNWSTNNVPDIISNIYLKDNAPLFSWSMGSTFAVATYIVSVDASSIVYQVKVYQWDETIENVTVYTPPFSYSSPTSAQLPVGFSLVQDDLVGSAQYLLRYDGRNWNPAQFTIDVSGKGSVAFAYGSDLAVMSQNNGEVVAQQFDPYRLEWRSVSLESATVIGDKPVPPTISQDFLILGTTLYYRTPQLSWSKLDQTLPADVNDQSIHNRAPFCFVFERGTGNNASGQVMLLKNGQPNNPITLDGRIFVEGASTAGTVLVGYNAFVTYPADTDFDHAQSLSLYHVVQGSVDEQLDFPVASLSVTDQYQTVNTAYFYDPSAAIYDRAGGVAQYPIVRVYPGLAQPPPHHQALTENDIPHGYTENYFFNGVSSAIKGILYPDDTSDYYSLLSGQLVYSKTFNSKSQMVASSFNYWSAVTKNAQGTLPGSGAYLRVDRSVNNSEIQLVFDVGRSDEMLQFLDGTISMPASLKTAFANAGLPPSSNMQPAVELVNQRWMVTDIDNHKMYFVTLDAHTFHFFAGVSKMTETSYDDLTGLPLATTSYNRNIHNEIEAYVTTNTYAWKVFPDMFPQHLFTPTAQVTTTVNGQISEHTVTMYEEWGGTGSGRWAPRAMYQATQATAIFDFTRPYEPQPGWLKVSEVVSRTTHGQIEETYKQDGIYHSILFDQTNNYPIATFSNASLTQHEVSFYGGEIYEADAGWRMQPGNQQPNKNTDDSHTGMQCLQLNPAKQGELQNVFASLHPTNNNEMYLFSCWYKTQDGFDQEPGEAAWLISASDHGKTITFSPVPMVGTQGSWTYLFSTLDLTGLLPASPEGVTITLQAYNHKSTHSVLLDELRFSAYRGMFGARVYDPYNRVPNATLGSNGETIRYVRNAFQDVVATIGPAEIVSSLSETFFSRTANGDSFLPTHPNSQLAIQVAKGGTYQRLTSNSSQWQNFWQTTAPGVGANWNVKNGGLYHQVSQSDALTLKGSDFYTNWGIQLSIIPQEPITQKIGITLGKKVSVHWMPADDQRTSGSWELYDIVKQHVITAITPPPRFSINLRYRAALDGGMIPVIQEAFASKGILLSDQNTMIRTVQPGKLWLISDPDHNQNYNVTTGSDALNVTQLTLDTRRWLVIVVNNAVLFYVDGQPVLSYQFAEAITGPLALFTSNRVAYEDIVIFQEPQISLTYQDGCGRQVQTQVLEDAVRSGGTPASNHCIVTGVVYDALGRTAVKTKPVRYENTLIEFQKGLVQSLEWRTGLMQGDAATYYSATGKGFSDDQSYPYLRTLFEDSPQARVIAKGNPGLDFAITGVSNLDQTHTQRYEYAANQAGDIFADFKLYAGEYYVKTAIDPNGVKTSILKDRMGHQLVTRTVDASQPSHYVTQGYDYDSAGRVVATKPPNYYDSGEAHWISTKTYNFLGQVIQITEPEQETPAQLIYDQAGRPRFLQPPNGATAQSAYFLYQKYDAIGRATENGSISYPWHPDDLQAKANDPSWPQSTMWKKRFFYDGDGTSAPAIGRLSRVLTKNGENDQAAVEETSVYDVRGAVISTTVKVSAYDDKIYTTGYDYDNLGHLIKITYPDATQDRKATEVTYHYNSLGQLTSVGASPDQPDSYAAYTYNASSRVESESWHKNGPRSLQRTYQYNSPGWFTQIADNFLSEKISYLPQRANAHGYYDGQIAATDYNFQWANAPASYSYHYQYDDVGNLIVAENNSLPSGSIGVGEPVTYDGNGNFQTVKSGNGVENYTYWSGTNKVRNTDGSSSSDFRYDANGNMTVSKRSEQQASLSSIACDPVTQLATTIEVGSDSPTVVSFQYGGRNKRVLKESQAASNSRGEGEASNPGKTSKLYLYGNLPYPLIEKNRDSSGASDILYIYGLGGMLAMSKNQTLYYISKDHQRSTRAIVDVSGPAPTVVASFDYTPFGTLLRTTGDQRLTNYLYTGQEYDPEIGLHNYRARLYDAGLRRFYAPDPAGQFSSPYLYAGNNPVLYADPTGQFSWSSIVGFVVSGLEVVAGVALDALSLGTLADVGGGTLLGAGINGLVYTAMHINDFSWGAFGVQEAIGAAIGTVTAGLGVAFSEGAETGANVEADIESNAMADAADAGADVAPGAEAEVGEDAVSQVANTSSRGECAFSDSLEDAPACFVAGTEVLTEHGLVAIEQLTTRDLVWAFDEDTSKTELRRVLETFTRTSKDLVSLRSNSTLIQTTPEHPFWVEGQGWTPARDLKRGNLLVSKHGERLGIEHTDLAKGLFTVFNFEVEGAHTYYVSEQQILVHNPCSRAEYEVLRDKVPPGAQELVFSYLRTPEEQIDALTDIARFVEQDMAAGSANAQAGFGLFNRLLAPARTGRIQEISSMINQASGLL